MSAEQIDAGELADLKKARKLVIARPEGDIAVFWHEDQVWAMGNLCVHGNRELVKGNIFQNRVICPGHQWAFDLQTGFCAERDRTQPVFSTSIEGTRVVIHIDNDA